MSSLAAERRFPIEETERRGHAVEPTEQAVAAGVDLLAVCGGDGTVHEVVQGLLEAGALDSVTLAIVPAGTENIVATDVGIRSLSDGFEVAERGETRRIDLGMADGEPFVMSAVAGLPADVSAAATHELKRRFGPSAFVVGAGEGSMTFSLDGEIRDFERAQIRVRPGALDRKVGAEYDPRHGSDGTSQADG